MSAKRAIDTLREQLDALGVSYSNQAKEPSLRKLLAEAGSTSEAEDESEDDAIETSVVAVPEPKRAMTIGEYRKDALTLVRVIVRCNDPNKKDYDGDVFSVGNEVIGFINKYVPFNNEEGWYVPKILVQRIKDQKVQLWRTKRLSNGMDSKEGYITDAFVVQELPNLTKDELEKLARSQKERNSVD